MSKIFVFQENDVVTKVRGNTDEWEVSYLYRNGVRHKFWNENHLRTLSPSFFVDRSDREVVATTTDVAAHLANFGWVAQFPPARRPFTIYPTDKFTKTNKNDEYISYLYRGDLCYCISKDHLITFLLNGDGWGVSPKPLSYEVEASRQDVIDHFKAEGFQPVFVDSITPKTSVEPEFTTKERVGLIRDILQEMATIHKLHSTASCEYLKELIDTVYGELR